MSSFIVPIADPGPPQYLSFPNVIRASSISGLLQRDRFIVATSRRCLFSCGKMSTTSAVFGNKYRVKTRTSPTFAGNVNISVFGVNYDIEVEINGNTWLLSPTGAQTVIAAPTGVPPDTEVVVYVRYRRNAVGASSIEGIYIIETALLERDLP